MNITAVGAFLIIVVLREGGCCLTASSYRLLMSKGEYFHLEKSFLVYVCLILIVFSRENVVISLDLDLSGLEVNQCEPSNATNGDENQIYVFHGSHKCSNLTTQVFFILCNMFESLSNIFPSELKFTGEKRLGNTFAILKVERMYFFIKRQLVG